MLIKEYHLQLPINCVSLRPKLDNRDSKEDCYTFARWFHARLLAILLVFEAVVVAVTATVPEPGAPTVFHVVEPFDGEVAA